MYYFKIKILLDNNFLVIIALNFNKRQISLIDLENDWYYFKSNKPTDELQLSAYAHF